MPSKLGFGNSRTPMTKKVSYGSAMHYKNPIKQKTDKKVELSEDEKTGYIINDIIKKNKKKKSVDFMGGIDNYNEAKALQTKGMQTGGSGRVINSDIY